VTGALSETPFSTSSARFKILCVLSRSSSGSWNLFLSNFFNSKFVRIQSKSEKHRKRECIIFSNESGNTKIQYSMTNGSSIQTMSLEHFICFTAWRISILGILLHFLHQPSCQIAHIRWFHCRCFSISFSIIMITINCEIITHNIQLLCFLIEYLTAMTQEVNLQKSW